MLQIWKRHGGNNQKWKILDNGMICSVLNNDFCIDIVDNQLKNGAIIQLWQGHGGINQLWEIKRDS